jgi:hypothetical protein
VTDDNQLMATDRTAAIEALLRETEAAHGAYEASELNGIYDQQWPAWYAGYAVDHGLAKLIGRDIGADELAAFFANSWAEMERAGSKPTDPWPVHMARRIAADL